MFGRGKSGAGSGPAVQERPGAKNRPTPKRTVAEAANRRPLVPTDRKTAARGSREQVRDARLKQRAALLSGDERGLPARDAGPERRYVRDFVDARLSAGELLLPSLALTLVLTFTRQPRIALVGVVLMYGLVLGVLLDAIYLRWRLGRLLTAKFGSVGRGVPLYAITRSLQIRRWRLPRPQVKRRQYPS